MKHPGCWRHHRGERALLSLPLQPQGPSEINLGISREILPWTSSKPPPRSMFFLPLPGADLVFLISELKESQQFCSQGNPSYQVSKDKI